jgi:hypothetical protein
MEMKQDSSMIFAYGARIAPCYGRLQKSTRRIFTQSRLLQADENVIVSSFLAKICDDAQRMKRRMRSIWGSHLLSRVKLPPDRGRLVSV